MQAEALGLESVAEILQAFVHNAHHRRVGLDMFHSLDEERLAKPRPVRRATFL